MARDSSAAQNETGWSSTLSATTLPPPTDIEILGAWATGTTHAKESGNNRALIFIAHEESASGNTYLSSVTYGGQAMTKVIEVNAVSGSYGNYVAAFILNEAGVAAASSGTFSPTWSGTTSSVAYASVFLSNVDQTTSIGASARAATTASTPNPITTSALVTNDGDMAIVGVTCGNNGSYTLNNGFTEGTDQSVGTNGLTGAAGRKAATGAAETPSATYATGPNRQAIIGFVVQAGSQADLPPAAPTGLVATAGNESASLDWNDNSEPDMNGYNVYRSTTQGGGYVKLNSSLLLGSDYADNGLTNGITYYYVVKAVDDANQESVSSSEASATPAYQNCADVISGGDRILSDLSGDCYVDYYDLEVIANYWMRSDCSPPGNCQGADFEPADGTVDFFDLSDFSPLWMTCNNPGDPDCTP
jgi:hypothetical protein